MKIIQDNQNATCFPLTWTCSQCTSTLVAESASDLAGDKALTPRPFFICPLCNFWTSAEEFLTRADEAKFRLILASRKASLDLPWA